MEPRSVAAEQLHQPNHGERETSGLLSPLELLQNLNQSNGQIFGLREQGGLRPERERDRLLTGEQHGARHQLCLHFDSLPMSQTTHP